jgi:xylan 1,4-beta-xylosidase
MKNTTFCFAFVLLQLFTQTITAVSPSFRTYTNPVIPGDHADPTLTRVGNDFYTTGSSFNPTPVIYHSTDLVHWEAIAQPVKASWQNYGDRPSGGCWGGHLVYFDGKYWDFFSRGSMFYVQASDPKGPWSDPVRIRDPKELSYSLGYDNSVFVDEDGKWYLIIKNGQPNNAIVELGKDGQPTGVVYDLKWLNPKPAFPFSWAEGPVMWKRDGYYYYSFAKNVTGGQWVMRTKTLTADSAAWEMQGAFFDENDPLKKQALFRTPNHSSPVVHLNDGTDWVISQSYAENEWKGHARQGLLTQVRYVNGKPVSDYPVNRVYEAPELPSSGIPWMVPKSDFFHSVALNPEWSFLGYTPDSTISLSDRKGWLRLSPKKTKANTVIKIEGEKNYSLITRVDFKASQKESEAGLQALRSDEKRWARLFCTADEKGKELIVFSDSIHTYSAERLSDAPVWLKMERINHGLRGYFSMDGADWIPVGEGIDTKFMDDMSANWIGTRIGLYVQNQPAFFDLFIYRDAYAPIMAGWPANQKGTSTLSTTDEALLDDIQDEDWALFAGVEFGGDDDYKRSAQKIQITAACESKGGAAEVWLDSIGTGKCIGVCQISNTGGWNQFRTFSAKIGTVRGRHDVYFRFKGKGGRLFRLKSFVFLAGSGERKSF